MGVIAKVSLVVEKAQWLGGEPRGGVAVTGLPASAVARSIALLCDHFRRAPPS